MSRRVVVTGAVIGPWMGVKGTLAATDALIDALLEGKRKPRGHFLRLYRERRDAAGIAVIAAAGHRTAIAVGGRTCADGGTS